MIFLEKASLQNQNILNYILYVFRSLFVRLFFVDNYATILVLPIKEVPVLPLLSSSVICPMTGFQY